SGGDSRDSDDGSGRRGSVLDLQRGLDKSVPLFEQMAKWTNADTQSTTKMNKVMRDFYAWQPQEEVVAQHAAEEQQLQQAQPQRDEEDTYVSTATARNAIVSNLLANYVEHMANLILGTENVFPF